MANSGPLLDVSLRVDYPNRPMAIQEATFTMRSGEILGLVGESGSGKSTIALALLRLLTHKMGRASGRIMLNGRDLLSCSEREMERTRGKEIGLVLQSPLASLNPALRIGTQLEEAWRVHQRGGRSMRRKAAQEALARVGLPTDEEFRRRYPSQVSVGQAQRVLIAMALIHSPALLIADEPTSALDVVTQTEMLKMLAHLNQTMGTAILFISHDLQSVAAICQRIAVLYDRRIVEIGRTVELLCKPQHPYTRKLLESAPWLAWWKDSMISAAAARPQPVDRDSRGSEEMPPVGTKWGLMSGDNRPMYQ